MNEMHRDVGKQSETLVLRFYLTYRYILDAVGNNSDRMVYQNTNDDQ